jgi:hypothetical protein
MAFGQAVADTPHSLTWPYLVVGTNVSQRPIAAGHDWPLYGDGYDRMKFGNVLTDFKRRVGNAF